MADGTFRGSRAQLLQQLRELPALLAGRVNDSTQAVHGLMGAVGLQALAIIRESYIVKARGGTDEAGIRWAALSPRTIAYGRRHPKLSSRRRYAAKAGRKSRPLLTAGQDKLWKQTYARMLRRFERAGNPDAEAHAAAIAWKVVKQAGGKTILEEYGKTPVEIGRDTGRVLASLSPGRSAAPANADQVFRITPGEVRVGTNVEYAEPFHRKRPLWPDDPADIPESWWERLGETLEDGLKALLRRRLG